VKSVITEEIKELKRKGNRFKFECPHCGKEIDIVVMAGGTAISTKVE
jgi:predicted RNA-binding Zn-ribbon protein involved in translation (DUF1610 family)